MKALSTSQRILTLLTISAIILLAIYPLHLAIYTDTHTDVELPNIQGVVLNEAQQLADIQLTDHQGKLVNRDSFIGQWQFISYGYTHCPDICPTTLFTLTQLADLLSVSHEHLDTQFVFYTIDPDRDSQKILAQYIHYFSDKFVAVRANTSVNAEIFQQNLGIKVEIINGYGNGKNNIKEDHTNSATNNEQLYQVNHGLAIFLINPKAELQAVFLPEITELGMNGFTSDRLYHDYLKIIKYYQQRILL